MNPYTKTNWHDRVVERPRTYEKQDNPDGAITLVPAPGVIHDPGTPVNAVNLNKLEQGVFDVTDHLINYARKMRMGAM